MNDHTALIESVLRSNARTHVLLAVADGYNSTQELLDRDLASESAVYNALTELQEHGLIVPSRSSHRWSLTGAGQIVADHIEHQHQTESVLVTDLDYWQTHDVTVIPPRFRLRLSALTGGEVVRATETRPAQTVRAIEQRLLNADTASALLPIYNERLAEAASDIEFRRVVCDADVFQEVADENGRPELNATDGIRITDVSLAVSITDNSLLLSLPTLNSDYDSQTELIVDTDEARQWGKQLIDHYWASANSPEQYTSVRS
ncbi:hypothetical protein DMJ13_20725 [halophilic archaeon]|nr:hypothetical protein DMJ13_20725 [halophilic archaeon]